MSLLLFAMGAFVSLSTWRTNAHVSAIINKQAGSSDTAAPAVVKPTSTQVSSYQVLPDMPRYIRIPSIGVSARVMNVGENSKGAISTPSNVFDTAWYNGSAKPGTDGAALIDGHVSSWTTKGVFYNLKMLTIGDTIDIERGDGSILHYQVAKTQVYDADNVDMHALLSPVTAGKQGLNLITCTGQVVKGTSEFNQREVVFAERVN